MENTQADTIETLLKQHIADEGVRSEKIQKSIDWLSDIVAGPQTGVPDEHGNPVRSGGIQEIVRQSNNGGIKVRKASWQPKDTGVLVTALTAVVVALLS